MSRRIFVRAAAMLLAIMLLPIVAFAENESVFLAPGETIVQTDTAYKSQNVAIEITTHRTCGTDVYVADIWVKDLECLQRIYGADKWGTEHETVPEIVEGTDAIIALTGDSAQNFTAGWVIGNGVVERDVRNRKRDLCILYRNGEMVTLLAENVDHEKVGTEVPDIWQTFLFGPTLLDENGKAYSDFRDSNVRYANPRSVIGYYEPGHYCFVQIDGRSTKSALEEGKKNGGMTLTETAAFMESLGCAAAYNLDGGRSSMLWYNGDVISTAADAKRHIGDMIIIKEPAQP